MADPETDFKVGDRIVATASELNGHMGTIKYIGPIPGNKGTWYGIELDHPVGRHDGSHKGTRYFESRDKHGVFLKVNSFIPVEVDLNIGQNEEQSNETATGDETQETKTEENTGELEEKNNVVQDNATKEEGNFETPPQEEVKQEDPLPEEQKRERITMREKLPDPAEKKEEVEEKQEQIQSPIGVEEKSPEAKVEIEEPKEEIAAEDVATQEEKNENTEETKEETQDNEEENQDSTIAEETKEDNPPEDEENQENSEEKSEEKSEESPLPEEKIEEPVVKPGTKPAVKEDPKKPTKPGLKTQEPKTVGPTKTGVTTGKVPPGKTVPKTGVTTTKPEPKVAAPSNLKKPPGTTATTGKTAPGKTVPPTTTTTTKTPVSKPEPGTPANQPTVTSTSSGSVDQAAVENLNKEIKKLKAELDAKSAKNEDLVSQVLRLTQSMEAKIEENEEKNELIQKLEKEIAEKNEQTDELIRRNGELVDKNEQLHMSFRNEKEDLKRRISEVQTAKANELKQMEEMDSEYKSKYREAHLQLQEALKDKKELDFQVKKLQRELESTNNSEELMENLILEKDSLAEKVEILTHELEEAKNQIKYLEEEKELQQLEAEEALLAQGEGDIGELKLENMKLKQALEKLYVKSELDKKEAEAKIRDMSGKVESIPKIEEKDKMIKQLNEEIKKLGFVIEDLKLRVDDGAASSEMSEVLTEKLFKKEDELIEMKREIANLKKDIEVDEQLIDEQEEYLKALEKDVMDRDVSIDNMRAKIEEHILAQAETEKMLQKFKEKVKTLNEEVTVLKQKTEGGDEKRLFDKIDELSHKQIELISKIRENHSKQLSAELEKIRASNECLKYSVLVSVLPKNLKDKMYIECLNKFIQIVLLKDRINLLVKEVKVKYMKDEYYANENIELISWLKTMMLDLADIILYCDILELKFYSFDHEDKIPDYVTFAESNIFKQLLAINSLVEQIFNNIKEDTLSVKFNLETLRLVIGKLTISCQEYEDQFAFLPLKLKKLTDQTIASAYELYSVGLNKHKKLYKIEKIMSRLEEFNYKFHKSLIQDDGSLEDKHDTNLEIMISLKYSFESFCEKVKGSEKLTEEEYDELELESEKECSRLNNYQTVSEDEHLALTLKGPWNQINNTLRSEIEQVSETAISFDRVQTQLKEQIKLNAQQVMEIKDINNIKAALEKRVIDLQLKAEKVVMLEMEKKRFLEKEVHFKEATEKIGQMLEKAEHKVSQLEEENKKLRQNVGDAKFGKATPKNILGKSVIGRESVSQFEGGQIGGVDHEEVEEYLNIITKLGEETVAAKSEQMRMKVQNLNDTMPEFAKYMERFAARNAKEKEGSSVASDDKAKLGQIVTRVAEVGKRAKLEICQSQIIPLEEFSSKSKIDKQDFVERYLRNKSEGVNDLRVEVKSLSSQILGFASKIEEQFKFKPFLEPKLIDLMQTNRTPLQNLGKLEVLSIGGSSGSSQLKTDDVVFNNTQLHRLRQLIV